ncbi:hypothetical protein [Halotia branconii]|uniref:Uncharacterized protein n=1 Tax=Halotia branconii CENA392 TaxID=1539056 RepID=A0AAJ6NMW4_9CYAN|nr:hypothetical protein [Halotia branconii]WGV23372.1 hypothetical protein QI031_16220 [Halotia branconii CENA392]
MQITLKDALEFAILISGVIAVVVRITRLESKIHERITAVDNRLLLHISECNGDKEMVLYRINGLNEKIDHKFGRLHSIQKDIQDFLAKTTSFIKREGT